MFYAIRFGLCSLVITGMLSCTKEVLTADSNVDVAEPTVTTKAVLPEEFDWETADWMPTPPGETRIPVPWIGQGSLSAFYKMDVVMDYKKIDGWRLVYSTFTSEDVGELENPYFVLYNVYRGTMRVYLYVTTEFVTTSSYLQDCLYVEDPTGRGTKMLNYLSGEIIDPDKNMMRYSQIQPEPIDGGAPLSSRRWYMMEYEMAYDSRLSGRDADDLLLLWHLNYYDIYDITIDGNSETELNGTVGKTTYGDDPFKDAAGKTMEGVFSMAGMEFMQSMVTDENTGENKIGISSSLFKSLLNGVTSAVSSFGSGIPSIALNLFNAIFGGAADNTSDKVVSLRGNSTITLGGNSEAKGSFPSMPITWWVPGTDMSGGISGYIPLYNEPMGVFYWNGSMITLKETKVVSYLEDDIMFTGTYYVHNITVDLSQADKNMSKYTSGVVINPYLKTIADVTVEACELRAYDSEHNRFHEFPLRGTIYQSQWEADVPVPEFDKIIVKFIIKVQPKDGAPASYIYKTFDVNYRKESTTVYN